MRVFAAVCSMLLLSALPAAGLTYAFTTGSAYGTLTWDPVDGIFFGSGGAETGLGYEFYPNVQGSWSFELYANDGTPIRNGPSSYRSDFGYWLVSRGLLPDYPDPLIDQAMWVLEYDAGETYRIDIRGDFCPRYGPLWNPPSPSCLTHFDFAAAMSATINGESMTSWGIIPEPGTGLLVLTGLLGLGVPPRWPRTGR